MLNQAGMKSVKRNKTKESQSSKRRRHCSPQMIVFDTRNQEWTHDSEIIQNMPRSDRFGKKALSYSIIKTSQWKVTVCPFIGKDQHSVMCADTTRTHTHTHTLSHTHTDARTHTFIKRCRTVWQSPEYHDNNASVLFSYVLFLARTKNTSQRASNQSHISVNHKQSCVQTVAKHRLEETKKALIRNTDVQASLLRVNVMCVCTYIYIYIYMCVCVLSFMNKSTTKK